MRVMPFTRPSIAPLVVSALPYLALHAISTGAIQVSTYSSYVFRSFKVIPVYYSSETYTGPGLQILYGSSFVVVRLIPFLIGIAIAVLFGLNVAYLWMLHKMGGLRTCLKGGTGGGVAAFIGSIATYSYVCCGWAPSMLLIGVSAVASFTSAFTIIPTAIAAVGLVFNAYLLSRRIKVLQKQSKMLLLARQVA